MHARGPASTVNLKCPASHPPQVQPETLAVIKWMQNYNFILSANLHGGAVVANYPFDKSRDGRIRGRTTYSATPDDKIFRKVRDRLKFPDVTHISYRHCLLCGYENTWMNGPVSFCVWWQLARTYSYAHGWMHKGWNCGDYFDEGITNGASWYSLSKGEQRKTTEMRSKSTRDSLGAVSKLLLRLAFVIELIVIETKLFTRCLHLFLASESASGFILCCFGTTKVSAVAQHQQH